MFVGFSVLLATQKTESAFQSWHPVWVNHLSVFILTNYLHNMVLSVLFVLALLELITKI